MLTKITRAKKRVILWVLAFIVIIPSFILWSGIAYLKSKEAEIFLTIGGKKLTYIDFNYYVKMANILLSLKLDNVYLTTDEQTPNINKLIFQKALEYILLTWKAQKEKIFIRDEEVIKLIKDKFFVNKEFDEKQYQSHIRRKFGVPVRTFEEYIREYLEMQKILQKYIKVEISEDEIKDFYKYTTQKAKIAYIFIPYESLKETVTIDLKELQDYYSKNELLFKEEPKVKINYCIILNQDPLAENIFSEIHKYKNLADLANKFNLEIKQTDFLGMNDPIENLGWQEKIVKTAFALQKNKISQPIKIDKGYVILTKVDEKEAIIPKFEDIKSKVEAKFKEEKSKELAKNLAVQLLEKINKQNISDLKQFAQNQNFEFKETDYFKIFDYVEGLGLDEEINKIIFSLKKNEVYSQPILLTKGAYIIKLLDITDFNEVDFENNKEKYKNFLYQRKAFLEKLKLLSQIEQESSLKIFNLEQQ
ncbi:MAG: SurA N-terminal domain-containing protein [Candidatus Omnitrophica bacterium]|nr:SurA N-terminal domain-containing protein [Candidatus Omnitrophota bacterium]